MSFASVGICEKSRLLSLTGWQNARICNTVFERTDGGQLFLCNARTHSPVSLTEGERALSQQHAAEFGDARRERLSRAVDVYLQACYRSKSAARASEFASQLELSKEYLSRVARKIAGTTLHEYIRGKQILRAEKLLKTTALSLEEIARRCAFGTLRTFYRYCSKSLKMTPGAYRGRSVVIRRSTKRGARRRSG